MPIECNLHAEYRERRSPLQPQIEAAAESVARGYHARWVCRWACKHDHPLHDPAFAPYYVFQYLRISSATHDG